MLAARPHFGRSLAALVGRMGVPGDVPVVASGMVGSAQGWREVPYLDVTVPLEDLPRHLARVDEAGRSCLIVPGYAQRAAPGSGGHVDVMRGEETQLLGALALGHRDGWMVLPGTHSKWVLLQDGVIRHSGTLQRIVFGERDRHPTPRTLALADALTRTSLDWEHADDVMLRMWEKLVMLAALAAVTCLFRGNVSEVMSAPGGREAAERALAANAEIAAREGYPPTAASLELARERLTDPAGQWSASMMRDMEGGRPVEADHIIGWTLERARRHGLDAEILSFAHTHLKTYERRRANGRLPGHDAVSAGIRPNLN
jgi:hypothetical protein